ncbi:MAG: hypothetical protein ACE14M_01335 [Terriglobales bacterium]
MNFTLVDTLGVLKSCFALAPFLFAPGYAIGWALSVFESRQRRPALRFALAVPLSIAICPIMSYLLTRFFQPGLWIFYGGASAVSVLLLASELRQAKASQLSKTTVIAVAILAVWVTVAIGCLVDLQIGNRLYVPVAAYDHSTRVAMMAAIGRHVPPTNPFFANPAVPLRYHYFWILLCSLPSKVLNLSPRYLTFAGVIWCSIGLIGAVALALKFLLQRNMAIARLTCIGAALLCVTGLDILPTLYIAVARGFWLADMEWWNDAPIASWAASLIWVPHHTAAFIACFIGFLLLRHTAGTSRSFALSSVILAGTAFASAAGMSVYVTFTFGVAIGLWLVILAARRNWREALMFVAAGTFALACAVPYLSSLSGETSSGVKSGGGFVQLAVRPFPLSPYLAQKIGMGEAVITAVNIVCIPINYAIELGFFFAVGILRARWVLHQTARNSTYELAAWTLVIASLLVGSFLQSASIATNDLGIRCFLPAQLVLLTWGAILIHDYWYSPDAAQPATTLWVRSALAILLFCGTIGTAYEVFMIRMAPVLYDRAGVAGLDWMDSDSRFGERTYALRSAYEKLNAQLSPSAVVQHNPVAQNYIVDALYSGHDAVAGGPECGTAFGGDRNRCAQRVRNLVALFRNRGEPEITCRNYGISVLVVKDTDSAWQEPSSWVWNRRPVVANEHVRAFTCDILMTRIHP